MTADDIQGWFDFQIIYDRIASGVDPDGTVVELGVWKGKSLIYLANRILAEKKPSVRVVGIDSFIGDGWGGYDNIIRLDREAGEHRSIYQQCLDNVSALCEKPPEIIVSDSIEAAARFADDSVDFVFVDDNHTPAHVEKEILAWLPKIKRPRFIAGHDYDGPLSAVVDHLFPNRDIWGKTWLAEVR